MALEQPLLVLWRPWMRIRRLQLRNFRCFEALDLELEPRVTLLVGANGSGKTSVLDALAVAAGGWLLGFPGLDARPIAPDEMRRGVPEESMNRADPPRLEAVGPTRVAASGTVQGEELSWARELRVPDGPTRSDEADELVCMAEEARGRIAGGDPVDLPVLAYYGSARSWHGSRGSEARMEPSAGVLAGYDACLDSSADQARLEAWMANADPSLAGAVARAAEHCVEGAARFYYSAEHRELRIDFRDGRTLPVRLLSDGLRNLAGLAADLAWRSARLNPHHGADAARRATGIVLIDEVDLHLHPRGQRRVLPDLHRVFPNLQIVATTHSPQVISTAPAEWLRVLALDGGPPRRVEHTLGRDSNSLLEDVLGASERPETSARALQQLFDLIDRGHLVEAERSWSSLRDALGPHDPDIVRARTILDLERELPSETGS